MQRLVKTFFHGALAQKYGTEPLSFAVGSGLQALRTLASIFPDFQDDLEACREVALITRTGSKAKAVRLKQISKPFGEVEELHLMPSGSGAGVEIAAAYLAVATTSATAIVVGTAINIAFGLALSFAVGMLTPQPKGGKSAVDVPSRIFTSGTLYTGPGGAQPIVYGRVLINGTQISSGITTQDIPIDA